MQDTDSLMEKFKLLIQQHNEHRIIFPRLITLLDYLIQGAIHWPVLILIANAVWVGVLWFFWKAFRSVSMPFWTFIPVPWLLLHSQYTDNVNWAISILQQSDIVFLYGLLVFLLAKKSWSWAMLVALVATFTHGSGIFSFPLGIMFCCMEKNWRVTFQWILAMVIVGIIYFWGFQQGQSSQPWESLSNPVRLIKSFFALFGGMSTLLSNNVNYAVALGFFFMAILIAYLIPKIVRLLTAGASLSFFDKLLLGNVAFLVITGGLVAVSRSWMGVESITAARYLHYSPFVACWTYLTILVCLKGRLRSAVAGTAIGASLFFNSLSYFFNHQEIVYKKNWLIADMENWHNHEVFVSNARSFNNNIRDTYKTSVERGISLDIPSFLAKKEFARNASEPIGLEITTEPVNNLKEGRPTLKIRISNADIYGSTFLYLQNKEGKVYWLPTHASRTSVGQLMAEGRLAKPGFFLEFLSENLLPGGYRVGILNGDSLRWTNQKLIIPE